MNKIIIALGLTLAASTGAFAESNFGLNEGSSTRADRHVETHHVAKGGMNHKATASARTDLSAYEIRRQNEENRELLYSH